MVNVSGTLYFKANDGTHGNELWKSDGTPGGTSLVQDINPGSGSSSPAYLTDVDGTLYFVASDGAHGLELWTSDGTPDGTSLVKDIWPGGGSSIPRYLTNVDGTLYFSAFASTSGFELWSSDGTEGGTNLVGDINPGTESSSPNYLTNVDGTLFLSADDGTHGTELWKAAASSAGAGDTTAPVTSFTHGPAGTTDDRTPTFRFEADDPNATFECQLDDGEWQTDCTSPQTTDPLDDGDHTFRVRATDSVGNVEDPPAERSFSLDYGAGTTSGETPSGGGTVQSESSGTGAQPGRPAVQLTTPGAGTVTFQRIDDTSSTPTGFAPIGTSFFEITAPDAADAQHPLALVFWIDQEDLPSYVGSGDVQIFRNGATVADCSGDPGAADPDPCVAERTTDGNDVKITVLSTHASTWGFGYDPAPDTTITQDPGAFTKDKTPRFKFTSSEGGADFECRIAAGSDASGAGWSPCTSPYDTPTLSPDGTYTFEVRAIDALTSTPDPTPASHTFLVDSTKPSLTIDAEPPDPTNQVPQHFEFSTSDPSPSSGAPTTECRIDTGSWDPCSSPQDLSLPDGTHTFRLRSTDPAGNVQTRSLTFTLDTQSPDTQITAHPPAYSNDTNPTFSFTGLRPRTLERPRSLPVPPRPHRPRRLEQLLARAITSRTPEGNHSFEVRAVDARRQRRSDPGHLLLDGRHHRPRRSRSTTRSTRSGSCCTQTRSTTRCSDPLHGGPPAVHSGIATCTDNGFDNENLGPHYFIVDRHRPRRQHSTEKVAYTIDPPDYGNFVKEDHPLAYYRFNEALGSDDDDRLLRPPPRRRPTRTASPCSATAPPAASAARTRRAPASSPTRPRTKPPTSPPATATATSTASPPPPTPTRWRPGSSRADSQNMMIMGHGGGGQLFISGGHLAFRQTQDTIYGGGPTLTPGKWWHVAATWDGHDTCLYVNGNQVAHSDSANKPPSGTSTFYVGYGEMAPWFHGTLDEAAYYDHALSQHRDRRPLQDRHRQRPPLARGRQLPLQHRGPLDRSRRRPRTSGLYAPTQGPEGRLLLPRPRRPGLRHRLLHGQGRRHPIASRRSAARLARHPHASSSPRSIRAATPTSTPTPTGPEPSPTSTATTSPIAYYRLGESSGQRDPADERQLRQPQRRRIQERHRVRPGRDRRRRRPRPSLHRRRRLRLRNGIQAPQFQSSLVAWVNAETTADASIVGHGDAGELFIRGGTFQFRRMDTIVDSHVAPKPGHFQQVVGTWDGVDIRIYVDGKLKGTPESTKRPSCSSTFYVGYGELEPWFAGTLDEVAYYPIGLSSDRVYQLWLADPPADLSKSGTGGGSTGGGGGSTAVAAAPRAARPEAAPRARRRLDPHQRRVQVRAGRPRRRQGEAA